MKLLAIRLPDHFWHVMNIAVFAKVIRINPRGKNFATGANLNKPPITELLFGSVHQHRSDIG